MLRRGIYLLGSTLLRRNLFAFHLAGKPFLAQAPRMLTVPKFRFASDLPAHEVLKMPALSPTMDKGKILKWYKKAGDQFEAGDVLCDVETDKTTVPFEMLDKGFIAKILVNDNESVKVGEPVVVIVTKKDAVAAFENFKAGGSEPASKKPKEADKPAKEEAPKKPATEETKPAKKKAEEAPEQKPQKAEKAPKKAQGEKEPAKKEGERVVASPYAKKTAQEAGIEIDSIKGSGPGGRVIKQDVDDASKSPKAAKQAVAAEKAPSTDKPKAVSKKVVVPENPFEQIELTSMRKTIASRLLESKTTIPHYYATIDINMDKIVKLREQLNQHEKDNGVKISINDFIMKATALACRDFPDVNVQWHTNSIRKFKYVDLAMAVATDKGLITPIIFRAETKGLLEIAKNSKELAKKARESKLLPQEFQGGTCSVSNVGMFGVTSIFSIINPPHSLILGVGKTEKKIVFDEHAKDAEKPYKAASMMTLVASADHRVVDGALAGQWLSRIKKYLEEPTNMLL